MYRVSSLGRPIDPKFSSNLAALVGSAFAAILIGIYNLRAITPLAASPVVAAVGVFLAWAIARELDPDHPTSAMMAMPISFVAVLLAPPALMLGTGVLIATRAISGTVGAPLRNLDRLAFLGLAGLLGAGGITVVALPGLLLAAAMGTSNRKEAGSLAFGMLGAAALSSFLAGAGLVWAGPSGAEWAMLILAGVSALAWPALSLIASPADLGGTLSARRVTVSRWTAVATVVLGFLAGGGIGITAAFPTAGAALVATAGVGVVGRKRGSSLQKERARL